MNLDYQVCYITNLEYQVYILHVVCVCYITRFLVI